MPLRRINDAQIERLLEALRDVNYRRELTHRILKREGVRQFTPKTKTVTAEYKRRYNSTMRRFQRYITESGERRSFARAPVQYQRETRKVARALPLPAPRPLPEPIEYEPGPRVRYEEPEAPPSRFERERDVSLYDLRAVVAYYDGDIREAAQAMGVERIEVSRGGQRRYVDGERLLELATQGEGVDVFGMVGGEALREGVRELLSELPSADVQDIEDFHDLLMNLPDWQIGMILADMEDEHTSFADWLDAWRADGMDLDADDSEYWVLWRAAYARSKA